MGGYVPRAGGPDGVLASGEFVIQTSLNGLTGRRDLLRKAAADMHRSLAMQQATWEPHDWSDFS